MALFQKWRGIAMETQQTEKGEELSLVRDSRGNWVNEATGEMYASVVEIEDGDEDGNA